MLGRLRQNTVGCVPGEVHIQKVFILSGEDFDKLSEDISPEYPFIRENAELMSAWPGGRFDCLLVTTEDEPEGILAAEEGKRLYLAYVKDCSKLYIPKSCPRESIPLEEPKVYQEQAVFYRIKPRCFWRPTKYSRIGEGCLYGHSIPIQEILRQASAASALAVSANDAASSIPNREQVDAF